MIAKLTPTKQQLPYISSLLGPIPAWIQSIPEDGDIKKGLELLYGFPLYETTGGNYSMPADGTSPTYNYPEDPELTAIYTCTRANETISIFEYGIVCILFKDGTQFTTRMD